MVKNWSKIKILHDKANNLMKKQAILTKDIEIKYKLLAKKKKGTKIYQTIKNRISNMETKNRALSSEITKILRQKDKLLKV